MRVAPRLDSGCISSVAVRALAQHQQGLPCAESGVEVAGLPA